MEENERIDYGELVAIVKKLEKNVMAKEVSGKILIEGRAIEFSPKSIITKSYRDMLNEIGKIEKIIAAVQYESELMRTMQEQQVKETSPAPEEQQGEITQQQEAVEPVAQVQEEQQPLQEPEAPEQTQNLEEERDNNKIVKKKKRDKRRRESDE